MTGELSLEAVIAGGQLSKFPGELGEKNARVVKESHARLMEAKS